jgi:beta-1,2-mannobiose phosphorylase / 1,2-beta-oligomannan phosphorylase
MADLAERFPNNPLLTPSDVPATRTDLRVMCVLNPGAFTYGGKTWLVLRVAEGFAATESVASAIILDPATVGGVRRLE